MANPFHRSALRPPPAAFRQLVLTEAKLAWRTPIGLVVGIGLPVILLIIFASIPSFRRPQTELEGLTLLNIYVPILIIFAIAILALTVLSAALAGYREQGVLRRLSTTPAPRSWVLGAQFIVTAAIGIVALLLMVLIAVGGFGVHGPKQVPGFILSIILTIAALFAMGLWIAAIARSARGAGGIGALFFYPMMFLAGLWFPRELMPVVLVRIGDYTPLGAAVGAMQDSMEGIFPGARALLVLVAYAGLFTYAAVRSFKWE